MMFLRMIYILSAISISSRDDVRFEEVRSYIKAKEVADRLGIKFKIVNPNVNE